MEKMKEELYKELHIVKLEDKATISGIICNYSHDGRYDYDELKALVKETYKVFKLNKAIELYNTHKQPIFINGMLIFNSDNDLNKRELQSVFNDKSIDCWVDDSVLVFSIKIESIRTIETKSTTLYREDESLLW